MKITYMTIVDDLNMTTLTRVNVRTVIQMNIANNFQFTMMITMTIMIRVEMTIDQVTNVIAMRDLAVTTIITVNVSGVVTYTRVTIGTITLGLVFDLVLIDVTFVVAVKTAVVKITDVVFVLDSLVTTVFGVDVFVMMFDTSLARHLL